MEQVINHFKNKGFNKSEIMELKNPYNGYNDKFLQSVLDYVEMTELELNLSLGIIPLKYRDDFQNNISQIANLLQKHEKYTDKKSDLISPIHQTSLGKLYNLNCIDLLKNLKDNSIDLIFADPPFNLNKTYDEGVKDDLSMTQYLNWCFEWIDECIRVLRKGGYLYIYNLPKWCTYLSNYLDKFLTFRNWISVDMNHSLPIANRLKPSHYALICYIKGDKPNTFNNQRIPLEVCRHCGGEIKDYGGYKSKMNKNGVNVSDVWKDIYPVRHKSTKNRKFNELSVKLLDRVISMSTNKEDLILDPFGGSGTTFAVAELLNRHWIGSEIGDCDIIIERINNPEKDVKQMKNIYKEKDVLFTDDVKAIRQKNGFWV